MPSTAEFCAEIDAQISRASKEGRPHVELNAGEIHRAVGGYPPPAGENHAMPACCAALRSRRDPSRDEIVFETESGQAAALTIRYTLPR
jgi:hypothetical protein